MFTEWLGPYEQTNVLRCLNWSSTSPRSGRQNSLKSAAFSKVSWKESVVSVNWGMMSRTTLSEFNNNLQHPLWQVDRIVSSSRCFIFFVRVFMSFLKRIGSVCPLGNDVLNYMRLKQEHWFESIDMLYKVIKTIFWLRLSFDIEGKQNLLGGILHRSSNLPDLQTTDKII